MKTFTLNTSHATKSFTKYQDFFITQVTSSVFGAAQLILEEYIDGRWERVTGSQVITGDTPEFITKINGARLRYRLSDTDNSTSVTLQSAQVTSDDGYAYQISEGGGGDGPVGPQGPQGEPGADGADSTVAGPAGPAGPAGADGANGANGADGADGADNATLDSVTSNGATTTNDITVGNRITTGNNVASGATATAIGGQNNTASGQSAEVLGGDGSTASGQGSSVIGGSSHQNAANWTATVGGLNQTVASGAARGAILGGFGHNLNHSDSVIIGGNTITTDATETVFVPNLNVKDGFKMPTGASDGDVLTTDANGVGTWQPAAGGGSPVVASYVDNSFVVNKPTSADVVVPVTQMAYQMQSGTTYYVKMFVAMAGTYLSGGNYTICPLILSHTPWAATAGVKKGFIGTNWMDTGAGNYNQIYSSRDNTYQAAGYDASASSVYIIDQYGTGGYGGWAMVEGIITAPSTATFTPTLSIVGGGGPTGTVNVSFQGMIMEMP